MLTPGQIRRYNEAGHLFLIDVFSPIETAEIRAYIDDLVPKALAAGWGNYDVVDWHKTCRGIWDIITEPRIIDVVADLLGDSGSAAPQPPVRQVAWRPQAGQLAPGRLLLAPDAQPGGVGPAGDRRRGCRQLGDARDPRLAPPRPAHLPRQRLGREQGAVPAGARRRCLGRVAGRPLDAGRPDLPAQRLDPPQARPLAAVGRWT